ncbi:Carboxylesterase type B [Penicillium paradoxum]|uniref:Carboxylesterase type B n=1 Tax=Penicillium paradoxum TaxID=176176 RepID=UPI0025475F95|nr:Carboxylesterase type B [Penicillium paradoxum]KAJ5782068.1 Carboxylesterase type B [Penicillium paradoxum]
MDHMRVNILNLTHRANIINREYDYIIGGFAALPVMKEDHRQLDSLGAFRVSHYNNLGPQNNGTSTVLVYDRLSYADATAEFAAIGEALQPWNSKDSNS